MVFPHPWTLFNNLVVDTANIPRKWVQELTVNTYKLIDQLYSCTELNKKKSMNIGQKAHWSISSDSFRTCILSLLWNLI